jgi:VIT1/CCC1 family predicted Fe2+/Mn2+ transporter
MDINKERHFKGRDTLRDIVIGMSDGLTVPFALAAGLSGAVDNMLIIIVAGLAEIAAGCISMGLGGYLAAKNDADHYESERKQEYQEIEKFPENEKKEVREIFTKFGLGEKEVAPIIQKFVSDKDLWVDFMMQNELNLEKPDKKRAQKSGLTIALSYLVAGFIPLLPYMFMSVPKEALYVSVGVTLMALAVFGLVKAKLLQMNLWHVL